MKSLRKIQEIENKIGATIKEGKLEGYFETVKNHTLVHYTPFIAFFESPEEFSTQAGEHHHIKKVKALYARSNRRNPEAYMLKLEQRNLNLSKLTIQSTKLRTPMSKCTSFSLSSIKLCSSINIFFPFFPFFLFFLSFLSFNYYLGEITLQGKRS